MEFSLIWKKKPLQAVRPSSVIC